MNTVIDKVFLPASYLQPSVFEIKSVTMHKVFTSILLASALLTGGISTVTAAEQSRKSEEALSFFERYTNTAQDVILQGLKLVGVRYRLGGNDEDSGLDCSGFVRLVFKDSIGTALPRTAREMSEVGQQIDTTQLKPGDLVFFNTMRRTFSHVGIYLGDNHFMHAPRTGAEVRVESMESSYWMKRYNGARRILEGN
jgi:cell wall-associated NlpC family hydrolase